MQTRLTARVLPLSPCLVAERAPPPPPSNPFDGMAVSSVDRSLPGRLRPDPYLLAYAVKCTGINERMAMHTHDTRARSLRSHPEGTVAGELVWLLLRPGHSLPGHFYDRHFRRRLRRRRRRWRPPRRHPSTLLRPYKPRKNLALGECRVACGVNNSRQEAIIGYGRSFDTRASSRHRPVCLFVAWALLLRNNRARTN